MKKIYWNEMSWFKRSIFSLGWLSVLSPGFWIVLMMYSHITQEEKFWSSGSYRVVYVAGWFNFISILLLIGFCLVDIVNKVL